MPDVHKIFIINLSAHSQEFEIHGWNNNRNLTVDAEKTISLDAADGTSGAIIALHDGHEGEQAEITKHGFGGMYLLLIFHFSLCFLEIVVYFSIYYPQR